MWMEQILMWHDVKNMELSFFKSQNLIKIFFFFFPLLCNSFNPNALKFGYRFGKGILT